MRVTVVYPLDHTNPIGRDLAEFGDRFRAEVAPVADIEIGLQKVHQLTTEGWAAWWSVVVSGCLS